MANLGGLVIEMTAELYKIGMRRNVFAFISSGDSVRAESLALLLAGAGAVEIGPHAFAFGDSMGPEGVRALVGEIEEGDFVYVLRLEAGSIGSYIVVAPKP